MTTDLQNVLKKRQEKIERAELLEASKKALDNFANAMNSIKPIELKISKCSYCQSTVIQEADKTYHITTRLLCKILINHNEANGKHFTIKMPYGLQNAWYILISKELK